MFAAVVVCAVCVRAALPASAFMVVTVLATGVLRPSVQAWSTCPSCRPWSTLWALLCLLAPERGTMACVRAVVVCNVLPFLQPKTQQDGWRECSSHRCSPGSPAPAADTEVRRVPGCVLKAVVCACTGMWGRLHAFVLVLLCVCGLCSHSLAGNSMHDGGAAAVGAALVYLPQLQTLT